ncbi:type II toxin-antitoxin system RelE/ParE family toxin [Fibrella aquatilis]|uniref:Type II toxin-antitoxin system RelE/ParE family toxin n=1 Tax=Fibrella aquatilis TaxID=2817059 RepID=A0A939G4X7_9BACT|nr:type II toxin-antitoxin system RelE/ParE family toxin [Fibrella aquatilis]
MTIYFSAEAEEQLEAIVSYLGENWSQRVKTDFLAKLSDTLERISQMPDLYRHSEKRPGLRECVLTKHTTLYYRLLSNEIEVVALLPTRRGSV